jgi:hypothetical protein
MQLHILNTMMMEKLLKLIVKEIDGIIEFKTLEPLHNRLIDIHLQLQMTRGLLLMMNLYFLARKVCLKGKSISIKNYLINPLL